MLSRRTLFAMASGAGLILMLGACAPTCTEDQLQAPVNLDPHTSSRLFDPSEHVDLSWGYPTSTCTPDFFQVHVWTGLEPETPPMVGRVDYANAASPGVWRLEWPAALEPGNAYFWEVCAGLETGPGTDVCGPSARAFFFTGPECTDSDVMQPVNLIAPDDGATFAPSDTIVFAWDDPTPCLVNYAFWLQISASPSFEEMLLYVPMLHTVWEVPSEETPLNWTESGCQRFYWRVKTDPAGPPEEPFSETRSFFIQPPGVLCPPEVLAPPMPAEPIVRVAQDAHCKAGPSVHYRIEDTFTAGVPAPVRGRNADGSWLQILSPNLQRLCWIWAGQPGLELEGDIGLVPVIEVPPPEVPVATEEPESPAPVNCSQITNPQTCVNTPGCKWRQFLTRPGGVCESE